MTARGRSSPGQALRSILREQARVFDELAAVVASQRRAVLEADPAALEELGARGQTLATRFGLLERERARLDPPEGAADREASFEEREAAETALARLLRETALLRGVVSRVGDVVSLRTAAVLSALGEVYLPNGRVRSEERRRGQLDVGV